MALQPATEGGGMPEALEFQAETAQLAELQESRNELLGRVNTLKKDLADWRGKLDTQVRTYRSELGELRTTLNAEVEQLRTEFQDLRTTLRQQLEGAVTSGDAAASDGGAPA
eukprot:PRCOL_00006686-RA